MPGAMERKDLVPPHGLSEQIRFALSFPAWLVRMLAAIAGYTVAPCSSLSAPLSPDPVWTKGTPRTALASGACPTDTLESTLIPVDGAGMHSGCIAHTHTHPWDPGHATRRSCCFMPFQIRPRGERRGVGGFTLCKQTNPDGTLREPPCW